MSSTFPKEGQEGELTDLEVSYLQSLADDKAIKDLDPGVTEQAIKGRMQTIRHKLGVKTSLAAVVVALRRYLID